jgi:hypothetical protein
VGEGVGGLRAEHRMDGWGDGWVRAGLIISFNIYISQVKEIQNEERGTSPRFCFWKFSVMNCLRSKKEKTL